MNIVFDLGGVVVRWEPHALIARQFAPMDRDRVFHQVVAHDDWLELDRGTLALDAAISRAATRTALPEADIAAFFAQVPLSLDLVDGTHTLLPRVKQAGHSLYCLSNMAQHSLDFLERAYDFWPLFDGRVFSCLVGLIKPEPPIYAHLLERHALDPSATVFIDDLQVNLDAAARFGIKTIRFESASQCERELAALGCALPR